MSLKPILHVLTLFSGNKNPSCIKTACCTVLSALIKINHAWLS
ncbi:Hypothetical protein ETEE_2549 [Edwardsiella anguillarum ET080813]|uniref:Uncharacterized protein n=1 Tax=Edwardsiella anguillarum ET080813 TaxID=667120 RepID=A0A076LQM3_9GAMM|nr:Hypothetical protein ETEE_2549 [Edwardsiella anguillarum ET080813]